LTSSRLFPSRSLIENLRDAISKSGFSLETASTLVASPVSNAAGIKIDKMIKSTAGRLLYCVRFDALTKTEKTIGWIQR
jgi:hypothetical protein